MDTISFEKIRLSTYKYVYEASINGTLLRDLIERCYSDQNKESPPGVFVAGFNTSMVTYSQLKDKQTLMLIKKQWEDVFDNLLLNTQMNADSQRQPLIVCSECADIGCGMITAVIESTENEIIWKDFAYQTNSKELQDRDLLKMIGTFRFGKHDYESKLQKLKHTILEKIKNEP